MGWTFREYNFLLAICLRTRRYEWNERENTRILRMQATTETNKTCLWEKRAAYAKAARAKASTSPWSAKPTSWANSLQAEEASQEAQKRLKAQRWWGASRRQCQTTEQTARRLLNQSEGMLAAIIRELKHLTSVRSRTAARPRRPGSKTAFLAPNGNIKQLLDLER